jgi:hypothetical protein
VTAPKEVLEERILRAKEMLLRLRSQAANQKRFIAELERTYREHYVSDDPAEADTARHKVVPER